MQQDSTTDEATARADSNRIELEELPDEAASLPVASPLPDAPSEEQTCRVGAITAAVVAAGIIIAAAIVASWLALR